MFILRAGAWLVGVTCLLTNVSTFGQKVAADGPAEAVLVPVELPITGTVDLDVKQAIRRLAEDEGPNRQRSILILEFQTEEGQDGGSSDFERCLSLARFLSSDELRRWRTVAFLPGDVAGHAVLPALACEEIVMHPDATLGDAGRNELALDGTIRQAYIECAERRRTIPAAVALGMLDRSLAVYRVTSLEGVTYVAQEELAALRERTTVGEVESIIAPGDFGRFTGRELRLKYGFVSQLASDRAELAAALQIAPGNLRENRGSEAQWVPLRCDLVGPVNHEGVNWIIRALQNQMANGEFNLLILGIDSPGGSATDSLRLANYLASHRGSQVRTVAFIAQQARADAVLPAFACDDILIGQEALFGGSGAAVVTERDVPDLRRAIRALARQTDRDWSLAAGLVDPTLAVYRYAEVTTGQERYFSVDEVQEQRDPQNWRRESELALDDGLTGQELKQLGVANATAEDFQQLRALYGLSEDIVEVEPNWAHLLIESLASPKLAGVLLFIGWFALFFEFSQPGLGIAGFLSAMCFLLFFWSQVLHGTAGWLEILLFLAGVISIVLEVLVIPGFGVFGLGGAAMVIVSLVLASQTFVIPRNAYQIEQLPNSLFMVFAAFGGALGALVVVHRYLGELPLVSRLLLAPPDDDDLLELDRRESLTAIDHLLGKRGTTSTPLTPAGKASFGDEVINVVSEGELVPRGVDVIVAEVRGNYALVRPVDEEQLTRSYG